MVSGVTQHGGDSAAGISHWHKDCSGYQDYSSQPRGGEIHHIVQLCGGAAKGKIPLGLMSDHTIHGVDGLVDKQTGESEQCIPENWRHHSVGEILGAGFHRRAGHSTFIERIRIAADNMADGATSRGKAACLQGQLHFAHTGIQAALGYQRHHGKYLQQPAMGDIMGDPGNGVTSSGGQGHHHHHHQKAANKARLFTARFLVEAALYGAHKLSGEHHGVWHDAEQKRHAAHHSFHRKGDKKQEQEMWIGKGICGGELRHLSRMVCWSSSGQSANDLRLWITT
jgi:hypothetical protein